MKLKIGSSKKTDNIFRIEHICIHMSKAQKKVVNLI